MYMNTKALLAAKFKAAAIHFIISLAIFAGILYLILVEWYPQPFFTAEGGLDGLLLMAMVDLVLGPSMTLIIYNHTKKRREIVTDLSVIAAIQITALIWGGLQVYGERPVALAMWEGAFYTVTEDYYQQQGVNVSDLASYSTDRPLLLLAYNDRSPQVLAAIMKLNEKKIPPYAQVQLYRPIAENLERVKSEALTQAQLARLGVEQSKGLYVFPGIAKHGKLLIYLDGTGALADVTEKPGQ
jgi:hypothetical protein